MMMLHLSVSFMFHLIYHVSKGNNLQMETSMVHIRREDILFITPSEPITNTISNIFSRIGESFLVYEAALEDAVRLAQSHVDQGQAMVVVSNGGTAALLKAALKTHVLELRYTSVDMLRAVNRAFGLADKIAVVGFESFTYNALALKNFFEKPVIVETLTDLADISERLRQLIARGVKAFVGGSPVVNAARALGAQGVHIDMDPRVIQDAIEEGKRIVSLQKEKDLRLGTINALLNSINDGIIGIDASGHISEINRIGLELLGLRRQDVVGRDVREVLGMPWESCIQTPENEQASEVCLIGGNSLAVTSVPIHVNGHSRGAVLTLQEVRRIQSLEQRVRKRVRDSGHVAKSTFADVVGKSESLEKAKKRAFTYAQSESTVLIYGKTGTGKELFAQSIHNASARADSPFVAVNCAALPENLLESELFGYVRGAFTGASESGKMGLFEMAHCGTIFLDEISEMPLPLQCRLLRVLQEKEVSRVGDNKVTPVDVRIIAATNRNLAKEVQAGRFREDLYYRLAVLILELPPLVERLGDIGLLARFILHRKSKEQHKPMPPIDPRGMALLETIPWPGNVRQLANVLERAMVIAPHGVLSEDIMADSLRSCHPYEQTCPNDVAPVVRQQDSSAASLYALEARALRDMLRQCGGNRKETARRLGIGRATLWRKMKKFGLFEQKILPETG